MLVLDTARYAILTLLLVAVDYLLKIYSIPPGINHEEYFIIKPRLVLQHIYLLRQLDLPELRFYED